MLPETKDAVAPNVAPPNATNQAAPAVLRMDNALACTGSADIDPTTSLRVVVLGDRVSVELLERGRPVRAIAAPAGTWKCLIQSLERGIHACETKSNRKNTR